MAKKFLDACFEIKSLKETGEFSGYASVFDLIDLQGDKIESGAFTKSLGMWEQAGKWPKMLWQHDSKIPIGTWHTIKQDSKGLFVKGALILELDKGREAYHLLKAGALDGLSIGFKTKKSRYDSLAKARVLQDIDLQEISLVTFAANPAAQILDVKAEDEDSAVCSKIQSIITLLKS